MQFGALLKDIWQGDIRAGNSRLCCEGQHLLRVLLPLNTICLSTNSALTRSRIFSDTVDLMPALPLGDVIAEELSIDVPIGTSIAIIKEEHNVKNRLQTDLSYNLGLLVGDALLGIVGEGVFPLEYESNALMIMANSYCRFIETSEIQACEISVAKFKKGLTLSLSEYWNGVRVTDKTNACCVFEGVTPKNKRILIDASAADQTVVDIKKLKANANSSDGWKDDFVKAILLELKTDVSRIYNY